MHGNIICIVILKLLLTFYMRFVDCDDDKGFKDIPTFKENPDDTAELYDEVQHDKLIPDMIQAPTKESQYEEKLVTEFKIKEEYNKHYTNLIDTENIHLTTASYKPYKVTLKEVILNDKSIDENKEELSWSLPPNDIITNNPTVIMPEKNNLLLADKPEMPAQSAGAPAVSILPKAPGNTFHTKLAETTLSTNAPNTNSQNISKSSETTTTTKIPGNTIKTIITQVTLKAKETKNPEIVLTKNTVTERKAPENIWKKDPNILGNLNDLSSISKEINHLNSMVDQFKDFYRLPEIRFRTENVSDSVNASISPSTAAFDSSLAATKRSLQTSDRCRKCPDEDRDPNDPRMRWVCGYYQRARRSFKSYCMLKYRNCMDGTHFRKLRNGICPDNPYHGTHMFY